MTDLISQTNEPDNPENTELLEQQPRIECVVNDTRVTLLGTAHVSRASAEAVEQELSRDHYDGVCVELCPSRYQSLMDPEALERLDLYRIVRDGKATMVIASLALGAFQQRMAEQFGIEPGAEMRAAIRVARERDISVLLVDREISVTLKRVYRGMPFWRRWTLLSGLVSSVVIHDDISEEEVEKMKQGDVLENTFSQFADQERDLYHALIAERDEYMALRIRDEIQRGEHAHLLVVLGAGHLQGIARYLQDEEPESTPNEAPTVQTPDTQITPRLEALDTVPPGSPWPGRIPWIIVALVITGFVIAFMRSPDLGWAMVQDWVLINGTLSAIGAAIALGHPVTIAAAFVAAPITSLNPSIGAGMVTAAIETWLRRPRVGDFSRLRHDTTHLSGWWKNRVGRILLVFLLSSLGSAIGTYVAGFSVYSRL